MSVIIPYGFTSKGGHRILLRSASPTDARALCQLSYEVISENDTLVATIEELYLNEEKQKESIYIYNNDPRSCLIVAEYNRQIIGMLTFQGGTLQKYQHHGSIGIIVKKDFRGTGVGKALLSTLIEWADYNPLLEKLCLEVLASNKSAILLYKSLGFIEEGRLVNQVKLGNGRYDDLIIMGKFLDYEWHL
ncbi:hypothetical protein BKP37_18420 [Anaerobacillus alkalilacustris]|uniref:N-acetyltransferase domain-containing protein n=1 Tax=Anaerobacillus alkalilacustris TaxID=393763 RepID=A0A1S2LE45_9BACI|nr:GNAT family protein [Anaerobacillus alkalilacustris]OIJ10510.1 hypothetical protein BKP37_18420 [Anaerobacillus alkalilacustris]